MKTACVIAVECALFLRLCALLCDDKASYNIWGNDVKAANLPFSMVCGMLS